MSEEILINITKREARVALVQNSLLQEIYIEKSNKHGLVGNIYKGRVVRVLPGMQSAFIDIGLERTAFLHKANLPALREGQDILVQVIKNPISNKGAKVTMDVSIFSRYLVLMPSLQQTSVSLKITDPVEVERLKTLLDVDPKNNTQNFIIRTSAIGVQSLQKDKAYLLKQWEKITNKIQFSKIGDLIYQDLSLVFRVFRDIVTPNTARVRVDSNNIDDLLDFVKNFAPDFLGIIEVYTDSKPIFELYNIDEAIAQALQRKVPLKNGGYLIIDQTEAMNTIDINTGAFIGDDNLEETVYRTNLEAISALCRQIRLRNLGGIIIIDFIDMHDPNHSDQVLQALEQELFLDKTKTVISSFSPLGLVQITRKRTRESLQQCMCETCHTCNGRGIIESIDTIVCDIFRAISRSINIYATGNLLIMASLAVVEHLATEDIVDLTTLEKQYNKTIKLQVESSYAKNQFDVVLL